MRHTQCHNNNHRLSMPVQKCKSSTWCISRQSRQTHYTDGQPLIKLAKMSSSKSERDKYTWLGTFIVLLFRANAKTRVRVPSIAMKMKWICFTWLCHGASHKLSRSKQRVEKSLFCVFVCYFEDTSCHFGWYIFKRQQAAHNNTVYFQNCGPCLIVNQIINNVPVMWSTLPNIKTKQKTSMLAHLRRAAQMHYSSWNGIMCPSHVNCSQLRGLCKIDWKWTFGIFWTHQKMNNAARRLRIKWVESIDLCGNSRLFMHLWGHHTTKSIIKCQTKLNATENISLNIWIRVNRSLHDEIVLLAEFRRMHTFDVLEKKCVFWHPWNIITAPGTYIMCKWFPSWIFEIQIVWIEILSISRTQLQFDSNQLSCVACIIWYVFSSKRQFQFPNDRTCQSPRWLTESTTRSIFSQPIRQM